LIIDEAQNLSMDVLEEIRLLTNLETSTEKLLQIVLAGQPELELKLKSPQLRQLRQRITLRCRTAPLTVEETFRYIAERLRVAGANGDPIFSKEAIETIYQYSQGIPRVVNLLCEHSLVNAYVDHLRPVPAHLVGEVAREFQLDEIAPVGVSGPDFSGPDAMTEAHLLLQNLNDLLAQLRQTSIRRYDVSERKS
jgi:general secretion pathway protein A